MNIVKQIYNELEIGKAREEGEMPFYVVILAILMLFTIIQVGAYMY